MKEASFVIRGWDVDVFQAEGFCDGGVDLEGGKEGFGGVEVDLVGGGALVVGAGGRLPRRGC